MEAGERVDDAAVYGGPSLIEPGLLSGQRRDEEILPVRNDSIFIARDGLHENIFMGSKRNFDFLELFDRYVLGALRTVGSGEGHPVYSIHGLIFEQQHNNT